MPRLYFIVSGKTASASESLINNLRPITETILIGTPTTGKGVGSWSIVSSLYPWRIQPITFRYYNKNHETIPDTGLEPDVYIDESNSPVLYPLGDVQELLLSVALSTMTGLGSVRLKQAGPLLTLQSLDVYDTERRVGGYLLSED